MNTLTTIFKQYSETIDKLLDIVESTKDSNEVKGNLLDASYLEFVQLASESPELKDKIPSKSIEDSSTVEFEKVAEEMKKSFEGSSFNFDATFKKAMKTTLENFVSNIGSQIASEKKEKLEKIVSEGF